MRPLVTRQARKPATRSSTLSVPPRRYAGSWANIPLEPVTVRIAMHGGRLEVDVPIAPPV